MCYEHNWVFYYANENIISILILFCYRAGSFGPGSGHLVPNFWSPGPDLGHLVPSLGHLVPDFWSSGPWLLVNWSPIFGHLVPDFWSLGLLGLRPAPKNTFYRYGSWMAVSLLLDAPPPKIASIGMGRLPAVLVAGMGGDG